MKFVTSSGTQWRTWRLGDRTSKEEFQPKGRNVLSAYVKMEASEPDVIIRI